MGQARQRATTNESQHAGKKLPEAKMNSDRKAGNSPMGLRRHECLEFEQFPPRLFTGQNCRYGL